MYVIILKAGTNGISIDHDLHVNVDPKCMNLFIHTKKREGHYASRFFLTDYIPYIMMPPSTCRT